MDEKWYIASNRWVRMGEGEAKCHVIWITSTEKPIHKSIVNLDFGYGRKNGEDEKIAALISATPELIKAAELAIVYDEAIQQCANDPEKMASFCTATGEDLDALYLDWVTAARTAIAKTKEVIPCLKK